MIDFPYKHQINRNEWAGACPNCGGTPHNNGELPDRFRVWVKSNSTGDLLGWCRKCGYKWTPKSITLAQNQDWIKEREEIELTNIQKAEQALKLLQEEKAWLRYNQNLDDESRKYYYDRKINDFWIEYWMLGYNPNKLVWSNNESYTTPAMTIPIFEPVTGKVLNIRNRLLSPLKPSDKYRPEKSGLPSTLYITDKGAIKDKVFIVEGEFKAMTTYIELDEPDMYVVGSPGKTPNPDIFEPIKGCGVAYILLDPDADPRPMAKLFGKNARIIRLPYKVDDMIVRNDIGKRELNNLIDYAWKWNKL